MEIYPPKKICHTVQRIEKHYRQTRGRVLCDGTHCKELKDPRNEGGSNNRTNSLGDDLGPLYLILTVLHLCETFLLSMWKPFKALLRKAISSILFTSLFHNVFFFFWFSLHFTNCSEKYLFS